LLLNHPQLSHQHEKQLEHIYWLHRSSKGHKTYNYLHDKSMRETWYDATTVIKEFDSYVSVNSFKSRKRSTNNLKKINAAFIDLDLNILNAEQVFQEVIKILQANKEVPRPNRIVFTGRGAHLYWRISNGSPAQLKKWQVIEDTLINIFQDYKVDKSVKDAARILRLPGTKNSKNPLHETESITIHDKDYTIEKLYDLLQKFVSKPLKLSSVQTYQEQLETPKNTYIGLEQSQKTEYRTKGKISKLHNLHTMHYTRLNDLVKLTDLRAKEKTHIEGNRELTLFIYANIYKQFKTHQEAFTATLDLNNRFILPIPEKEVIHATGSPDKVYKITNKKIIEMLSISELEQQQLSIIISTEEKHRRRNEKRTIQRRQDYLLQVAETHAYILNMYYKDYLNLEISKELNVSIRTIERVLNRNHS